MEKNKIKKSKRDPLPDSFENLETFWEFWDNHSSADYEDLMERAEFDVAPLYHKSYCAIANELIEKVRLQARQQGVSTETLINLWIEEKTLSLS